VENIILGFVFGAVSIGFITLITISIRLSFLVSEMSTIIKSIYIATNKIEQMSQATMQASENFVEALGEAVGDQDTRTPVIFKMFGSEDGKHTGRTYDELINKMKQDPSYKQMSEDDINEIRKLFEDNLDEDDDDSSEESNEPWKGK